MQNSGKPAAASRTISIAWSTFGSAPRIPRSRSYFAASRVSMEKFHAPRPASMISRARSGVTRVPAAQLHGPHAQSRRFVDGAQRQVERHMARVDPLGGLAWRHELERRLPCGDDVAVVVLPRIAVRAAVKAVHGGLEHELRQRGLGWGCCLHALWSPTRM